MLSLSMIVRDEAQRLERCLRSVAGFVDEMVVVDTGSKDDTVAIAERCGAVVHRLTWPGDFAPARNHALDRVHGDWVLVLDADEWLLSEAREPLRALMDRADLLLITLLRREQGAVQSPYSRVSRLFRRHPKVRWSRAYHSMVDDSVAELLEVEPHWRIGSCREPALAHDGYRPDRLMGSGKAQRLRQAMEAELRLRPGDPYACAKLGGLEISSGDRRRGIALLKRGLANCPQGADPERYELLLHLAIAQGQDDPVAAADLYRQALELPLEPKLTVAARLNLSALQLRLGALDEAAGNCSQVTLNVPEVALGWYNLGLIERHRGQLAVAIAAYRHAIRLDPQLSAAHQNLAAALLLAGDIAGARQGFRDAIALLERQDRHREAERLRRQAGTMVNLAVE